VRYCLLAQLLSLFLDLVATLGLTDNDKDLEIIILRQQVRILQRKSEARPRLPRPEKLILAMLVAHLHDAQSGVGRRLRGATQY